MAKVKRKRDSKVEHRVFSQPKGTAAPGGRGQRRLREAIVIINPKQMQSWASLTVPVQEHGQGEGSCFSSRIGYSSEVAPDRWERTSLSGDNFQISAGTNSVFLDWTHLLEFCCCYCCGLIFSSKLNLLALWLSLPREEQCCQLLPFASQMAIPFALWCKLDQIQIFITYLNYLPHLPAHTKYRINRSESSSLVFLSNSFVVD